MTSSVKSHTSTIVPLGDRVVVQAVEEDDVTPSGIVLPDTAKEKPQKGKIIAVGPGKMTDEGTRIPLEVKEGDVVLYTKYGPTEIHLNNQEYLILSESDILAIVK